MVARIGGTPCVRSKISLNYSDDERSRHLLNSVATLLHGLGDQLKYARRVSDNECLQSIDEMMRHGSSRRSGQLSKAAFSA